MTSYFFASPIDIDFKLDGEDVRKLVETKGEKDKMVSCPVYFDGDTVSGQISIRTRDGKKVQHDGIKVEFVGSIGEFSF